MSRHRLLTLSLACSLALAVTACGPPQEEGEAPEAGDGTAIPHVYGETTVEGTPERVVSIGLREHDALLALGVEPVALHQWYSEYESGVGPWAEPLLGDARPEVIPATQTEHNAEWIAEQEPDLIVGIYSSVSEQDYETLSRIAPTLVRPAEYGDYAVPYEEETRMIGAALGLEQEAEDLVSDTEEAFARAREEHPEFEGLTAAAGCPLEGGELGLYSSEDPRGAFLGELGFTLPEEIDEIAEGQYYAQVSGERIDMVEDYDLLVLIDDCGPPTVALEDHELFDRLDIAQEGRYVYPAPAADALSHNTVLSIPYAIEALVPEIAATLDR